MSVVAAWLVLTAAVHLPLSVGHAGQAGSTVPPAVANLLPKSAVLKGGDWEVFETEFGKTFTGGMRAEFPGRPSSCDMTIGPELRVSLKGDTAWEEPPMLDMAVQMHAENIEKARKSLPERMTNFKKTNSGVRSVGTLKDERLPNGRILYIEYAEECPRRPKGVNTVLLGFARKGATQLAIDLWISAGAVEARAMAVEMFDKFQKLDVAGLIK